MANEVKAECRYDVLTIQRFRQRLAQEILHPVAAKKKNENE
jgi:hypothetical protein